MSRILFVDDDPVLRDVLSLALSEAGHEIKTAEDGAAALTAILAAPPDVLVADVNMPRLDGFALCKRLREKGLTLPILLLTSRDTEIDEALGLELGALLGGLGIMVRTMRRLAGTMRSTAFLLPVVLLLVLQVASLSQLASLAPPVMHARTAFGHGVDALVSP